MSEYLFDHWQLASRSFPRALVLIVFGVGLALGYLFAFWEYHQGTWERYAQWVQFAVQQYQRAMGYAVPSPPPVDTLPMSVLVFVLTSRRQWLAG